MEIPHKLSFGINVLLDRRNCNGFANYCKEKQNPKGVVCLLNDSDCVKNAPLNEHGSYKMQDHFRSDSSLAIRSPSTTNHRSKWTETYERIVTPSAKLNSADQFVPPGQLIRSSSESPYLSTAIVPVSMPNIWRSPSDGSVANLRFLLSAAMGFQRSSSSGNTNGSLANIEKRTGHPYQSRLPARHKKPRTSFTKAQVAYLETRFIDQKYLASTERAKLAAQLDMSDSQVKTWRQDAEERECEGRAAAKFLSLASNYIVMNSSHSTSSENQI